MVQIVAAKHFAILKQGGGIIVDTTGHAPGRGPGSCRRIIQLGAGQGPIVEAARSEHLSVRE